MGPRLELPGSRGRGEVDAGSAAPGAPERPMSPVQPATAASENRTEIEGRSLGERMQTSASCGEPLVLFRERNVFSIEYTRSSWKASPPDAGRRLDVSIPSEYGGAFPVSSDRFDKKILAARLRALREERGLSLRELAARAGVAVSFLSKIEAAKASPTIMSLVKILEALDVEVARFFGQGEESSGDQMVFRRRSMRALREVDRTWWYAFPERRDIRMVLTYEEYQPRSRVAEEEVHKTDLCGYVLEGALTLEVPGRGTLRADAGDAFYIPALQRHVARNEGDVTLRMVVVQLKEP
jgi:transcriptional regulator with XRE-family HTH domain